MDYQGIITAVAVVAGCGVVISIFLSIFAARFAVPVNKKEEEIISVLPGNNCGGCGYPGCSGLAAAIVGGTAEVSGCPVGGKDVADKIAKIMGVDPGQFVRKVAFVRCHGTCQMAGEYYNYTGPKDCRSEAIAPGRGSKMCDSGCLGFGSCQKVCDNDAITIVDGIAVVDPEKCGACGQCVKACPMGLIEIVPYDANVRVACSSKDKGNITAKACKAGCVGCGICAKTCRFGAITVTDNLAHIDYDKCTRCGECAEKCPKKIITV
ncbi:MAG: RnfABCDGE type electron transport complex subunit B [Lachnospiraceae bacterium]|nr:RnfABCDGE type electron transport complex subunit B [Lachnospiraceae bacterium]